MILISTLNTYTTTSLSEPILVAFIAFIVIHIFILLFGIYYSNRFISCLEKLKPNYILYCILILC